MRDPRTYHLRLPPYVGPTIPEPSWAWWPGVRDHWDAASSPRTRHADGRVEAVVLHATAGSSSAGAMSVLERHRASWHFLIPDEDEEAHGHHHWDCIPERLAGWHVSNRCSHPDIQDGRRFINYWSVGIEVVNRQNREGIPDPFSRWQIERTAEIIRYLRSKHPDLRDVFSHAMVDPDRRTDPGTHFPWEELSELVLAKEAAGAGTAVESTNEPRLSVFGPDGAKIECQPFVDIGGATVAEVRPLAEALGFQVEEHEGASRSLRILPRSKG